MVYRLKIHLLSSNISIIINFGNQSLSYGPEISIIIILDIEISIIIILDLRLTVGNGLMIGSGDEC